MISMQYNLCGPSYSHQFKIKDLGRLNHFLGHEILHEAELPFVPKSSLALAQIIRFKSLDKI